MRDPRLRTDSVGRKASSDAARTNRGMPYLFRPGEGASERSLHGLRTGLERIGPRRGQKPMEGQGITTPATVRDATDSSVEQGLEAELSVDLICNVATGNGHGANGAVRRNPTHRSGEPDSPFRPQGRTIGMRRASYLRVRSGVPPTAASAARVSGARFAV